MGEELVTKGQFDMLYKMFRDFIDEMRGYMGKHSDEHKDIDNNSRSMDRAITIMETESRIRGRNAGFVSGAIVSGAITGAIEIIKYIAQAK